MSPVAAAAKNCAVTSIDCLRIDGLEPLAPGVHVLAGAVRDLAHRGASDLPTAEAISS